MYYSMVLKMTHYCFQLVYLTRFQEREKNRSYYLCLQVIMWWVTLFNSGSQTHEYINIHIYVYMHIYIYIWIKVNKTVVVLWVLVFFWSAFSVQVSTVACGALTSQWYLVDRWGIAACAVGLFPEQTFYCNVPQRGMHRRDEFNLAASVSACWCCTVHAVAHCHSLVWLGHLNWTKPQQLCFVFLLLWHIKIYISYLYPTASVHFFFHQ